MKHYKSAESVTKGHPDKLCDYIADSILDGYLKGDESSRVAVEVMATKGLILVAGEVTSKAALDVENIVRDVLFDVGYEPQNFEIEVRLHAQSPDIAQGVDRAENLLGAGDQGIVYGYATDETPESDITVTASGTMITNPGNVNAEPLITVYGEGDISLMVGTTLVELEGVSGSIVLDCELKEAYAGSALMNKHMTGEFPVLTPGVNAVSWSGAVTKVVVRPRWRDL